jgi:hypothetical protein
VTLAHFRPRPKSYIRFRCASCGNRRHELVVHRSGEPARQIVPACPDHPDATVLTWDAQHQGACIAIQQMVLTGGWDDVDESIEEMPHGRRKATFVLCNELMRRWQRLPD